MLSWQCANIPVSFTRDGRFKQHFTKKYSTNSVDSTEFNEENSNIALSLMLLLPRHLNKPLGCNSYTAGTHNKLTANFFFKTPSSFLRMLSILSEDSAALEDSGSYIVLEQGSIH